MSAPADAAARKVMVAALGNPDRGDDAVGVLAAEALRGRLPADVALVTRSGDMLSLIDEWAGLDALVCVDAAAATGTPGRMLRIDLATDELPAELSPTSSHAFGLAEAVRLARALGRAPADIVVYAVEGGCFDVGAPVTPEVRAAADQMAKRVVAEVDRLRCPLAQPAP